MKISLLTIVSEISEDAHVTCSPGPAIYYRTYGDTGAGPRQPVSARHREGINAGYPNPMVQPVDTHGEEELV